MSLASLGIPGRNILPYRSGYGAQVAADLVKWLTIGANVDWGLVPAAGSAVTLPDTEVMQAGWRYLRYGQVMCRVTGAGAYVVTVTASAGGTFTVSVANSAVGASSTQTTAAIPVGASAATVAQALYALTNVGYGNAVVTGSGPYNVTFPAVLGTTTLAAVTGATVATGPGGNPRFFGPYDSTASDGRAALNRGDCFILNRTKVAGGSLQLGLQDDQHVSDCIIGGKVWGAKVIATSGTHSLAAGPTWAELLAAMPELYPHYV